MNLEANKPMTVAFFTLPSSVSQTIKTGNRQRHRSVKMFVTVLNIRMVA